MNKDSDRWRITVHHLASSDMYALKDNHPEQFRSMMTVLKQLMQCENPMTAAHPINVVVTWPDAIDCLRVKQYGNRWRVILRFVENGVHVAPHAGLRASADCYLQIIFVDVRSGTTYGSLRARFTEVIREAA